MQKDWNIYGGKKAFHFVPMEIVDRDKLVESEQCWLDNGNPPYNIKLVAERNHGTAAEVSRQIHNRIRGIR